MKKLLFLLLMVGSGAWAAEGLVTMESPYDVTTTMDRLQETVTKAGFKVMARVRHSQGAAKAGLELAPEELLIFGKPKAGTLLMQSQATVGIDLPMKYLVWQDSQGRVRVAWNDPAWIARRHGIEDRTALVTKMQGALRKLAEQSLQP